jgi:hypothetical protein
MDHRRLAEKYDKESWLALYEAALIELEYATLYGRIKDARIEIVARVEKLQTMPGLHAEKRHAITDAFKLPTLLGTRRGAFRRRQTTARIRKESGKTAFYLVRNPQDAERRYSRAISPVRSSFRNDRLSVVDCSK